ncbi:MAG: hypothetical protein LBQ59_03995 [Candidatus Peribacteria bacterium]|nr:hypothetical protein [Candidatus Peribacteria bacterium]
MFNSSRIFSISSSSLSIFKLLCLQSKSFIFVRNSQYTLLFSPFNQIIDFFKLLKLSFNSFDFPFSIINSCLVFTPSSINSFKSSIV